MTYKTAINSFRECLAVFSYFNVKHIIILFLNIINNYSFSFILQMLKLIVHDTLRHTFNLPIV